MANLPLPTVTPIDTVAENLKDIDRSAELEKTAIQPAKVAQAALEGADTGVKIFDALDQRKKSKLAQDILAAGEPARIEFWQESKAPAHMDPRGFVDPSASPEKQTEQAKTWYKEMIAYNETVSQKAGKESLATTLADPLATPGSVAAAAVKAGAGAGDILTYAGKASAAKTKAEEDAKKKPGQDLDLEYKRARNEGQRLLNAARRDKNQGLKTVIGNDLKELKRLKDKLATISPDDPNMAKDRTSLETNIGKVIARISSYSRDVAPGEIPDPNEESDDDSTVVEVAITSSSSDQEIAAEIRKQRGLGADKQIPKATIDAVRARLAEQEGQ